MTLNLRIPDLRFSLTTQTKSGTILLVKFGKNGLVNILSAVKLKDSKDIAYLDLETSKNTAIQRVQNITGLTLSRWSFTIKIQDLYSSSGTNMYNT